MKYEGERGSEREDEGREMERERGIEKEKRREREGMCVRGCRIQYGV